MVRASRIDRYRPEELLGSSGLVDTFRVRVEGKAEPAVLKVLFTDRGDKSVTEPAAARFLRAGRHCQEASVAGTAKLIEVSDDPAAAFIATELVEGIDLGRLVSIAHAGGRGSNSPLTPSVAATICAEVARTLDEAHSHRPALFHLGLCPGNVVVAADGAVAVLDFGLTACLRKGENCQAEKWHFVAPELIGEEAWTLSADAAKAADFYSLGGILYFLLTGRTPGSSKATGSLAELAEQKRLPVDFPTGLPGSILLAGRALTAAAPEDRPRSAGQIIDMLGPRPAQEGHLEQALRALGIFSPPSGPEAALSTTRTRSPRSPRAHDSLLPAATLKRGDARAVRRDIRRDSTRPHEHRARIAGLTLVLALATLGGYHALRAPKPHRAAGASEESERPARPRSTEPVTKAPAPRDAGAPPPNPEISSPGHGYVPDPDHVPTRVPGRLFLDSSPADGAVWIDGVLRGRTPLDLEVGAGVHRIVAIKAGYRMWLAVYDTTRGEFARREFQTASPPTVGDAFLDVRCPVAGRYPIILDDEETGLVCPVDRLTVVSGKHSIGIFVPARRASLMVNVDVPRGRQPMRVDLKDQ